MLAICVICAGCRPEAEVPKAPRPEMPLAAPQAAVYLVDAQQALRQGDVGAALVLADSAEQHGRTGDNAFLADVAFLQGRIHAELNHGEEAKKAYERALMLEPTYRGAWLNMGNIAFREGDFSEALRYYRQEQQAHPNPDVLVYSGRAYAELGKSDSARQAYEQALALDNSLAEAYIRLAVLHEENGNVEQALSNAQRALALRPEDPDYRYIVGNALLQNEKLPQAEAQLRRTIEQQPLHAQAHYSLGVALARLGKQDEAERYLAKVDSLQYIEQALDAFERRTQRNPNDPAAWVAYGYALGRAGRDAEAIRAFQIALHQGPATPDVHFMLANVHLKHHQLENALGHYEDALRHDSSHVGAWVNKGICLARMGNPEAARQAWETALQLDPGQPSVKNYLANLPSR